MAGTWVIEAAGSVVRATARHLMVSKVRGSFEDLAGTIVVTDDPAESVVEVHIPTASIDTGDGFRDDNLRSPNFLDVEGHPHATFVSTSLNGEGKRWRMTGDLTLRGVTRPVELEVRLLGVDDNGTASFEGTGALNREDWGLVWNGPLEAGGVLVGKEIRIEIALHATLEELANEDS